VLVAARLVLLDADRALEGGGVEVRGGRITRLLSSRRAVRRAGGRRIDLDAVLTPGLVNAHAHLELGALPRRLPRASFAGWIAALLRARAGLRARDFERAVAAGARALLAGGTTCVGDVDSTGAAAREIHTTPIRAVVLREVLDAADPARTVAALKRVARALPRRSRVCEGLSPHAPYTTSTALLEAAGELAARRALPVQVHWAETVEEERWLSSAGGPLARVLTRSPRCSGLAHLAGAGLLRNVVSLVHGNVPSPGDPGRLARAGIVLVHCPGTHAFFRRPPFALERYRRAGVRIALGTDSLASNSELDLRRELVLLRRAAPRLSPREAFRMATENGARALGLERTVGRLRTGLAADLVAWGLPARGPEDALDELTSACPRPVATWVAGRRVTPRGAPGSASGAAGS
jgi:cytosine/adenosine deaminase-related metal-dependent hydrolase